MKHAVIFLLFALSPILSFGADSGVAAAAPVTNFKLSLLNDEGFRSSLLRGSEARYISDAQIDLTGMQYTTYNEGAASDIDSTLLAPSASVFLNKNKVKVHGDESVRLIRKNVDVTGERWTYDHTEKRILIEKNVRVLFSIELKEILK